MPTLVEQQIEQDRQWDEAHQDDALNAIRERDRQIAAQRLEAQQNAETRAEREHREKLEKRNNLLGDLFHVPETGSGKAPKQHNFLKDLMGAVSPIFQFFIQIFGNVEKIQKAMRPDGAPLRDGDITDEDGRLYKKALDDLQKSKGITTPSLNDAWINAGTDPKKRQQAFDQLIQRLVDSGEHKIANQVMKARSRQLAGHFTKAMGLQGAARTQELQVVAQKLHMTGDQAKKMCRAIEHFHQLEKLSVDGGTEYAEQQADLYHRLRLLEQNSEDLDKVRKVRGDVTQTTLNLRAAEQALDHELRAGGAPRADVRRQLATRLQEARQARLTALEKIEKLGGGAAAQSLEDDLRRMEVQRVASLETFSEHVQDEASRQVGTKRGEKLNKLREKISACEQQLRVLGLDPAIDYSQNNQDDLDDQAKVEAFNALTKARDERVSHAAQDQRMTHQIATYVTANAADRAGFLDTAQARITAGNGPAGAIANQHEINTAMRHIQSRQDFMSSLPDEIETGDEPGARTRLAMLREL